jgi:hypothetical protein
VHDERVSLLSIYRREPMDRPEPPVVDAIVADRNDVPKT